MDKGRWSSLLLSATVVVGAARSDSLVGTIVLSACMSTRVNRGRSICGLSDLRRAYSFENVRSESCSRMRKGYLIFVHS